RHFVPFEGRLDLTIAVDRPEEALIPVADVVALDVEPVGRRLFDEPEEVHRTAVARVAVALEPRAVGVVAEERPANAEVELIDERKIRPARRRRGFRRVLA